jgi:hypothetical protein
MELYQLGEYNRKKDLTAQGARIRDFVLEKRDFDSIRKLIDGMDTLEDESIIILKRAILAGYWDSYYGFRWKKEQEIEFWELVYSKAPGSGVAILTLAESYRMHRIKSLKEVMPMYFKAIEIHREHYFSLTQDGGDELEEMLMDSAFNEKMLLIELDIFENRHHYSKAEFMEERPNILKRCKGDKSLEEVINNRIDEILKRRK